MSEKTAKQIAREQLHNPTKWENTQEIQEWEESFDKIYDHWNYSRGECYLAFKSFISQKLKEQVGKIKEEFEEVYRDDILSDRVSKTTALNILSKYE